MSRLEKLLFNLPLPREPWAIRLGSRLRPRPNDIVILHSCAGEIFYRLLTPLNAIWFLQIIAAAPADVAALAGYITPESPRPVTLDPAALGLAGPGRHLGPGRRGWDAFISDCVEARFVATAATPLSEVERTYMDGATVEKPKPKQLPTPRRRREPVTDEMFAEVISHGA